MVGPANGWLTQAAKSLRLLKVVLCELVFGQLCSETTSANGGTVGPANGWLTHVDCSQESWSLSEANVFDNRYNENVMCVIL